MAMKFCFLLGKTPEKQLIYFKQLNNTAMEKTQVYKRFSGFKKGEMSINVQPHSWHPSTFWTDKSVKKTCSTRPDWRFLEDCMTAYSEKDSICGRLANVFLPWQCTFSHSYLSGQIYNKNHHDSLVQPANSPDLAPCIFCLLLLHMNRRLKGKCFEWHEGKNEKGVWHHTTQI